MLPVAKREDLVIAWPTPVHGMTAYTSQALVNCALDKTLRPRIDRMTAWLSGPLLAHARCSIVRYFLEQTRANWLLQIDTDQVFTPRDVLDLHNSAHPTERPVIGLRS